MPLSWLKEYVAFEATAEELADKLTFSGIEVEGIETIGGGLDGVVVGEIIEIKPHPGADRLKLCKVNNGREELSVVCGASNYVLGDKVPFAGIGVRLPDGTEIKKAKLRGETSFGMLCSEVELGLSEDHSGLMILDKSLSAGTPLSEVVGPPETVLELEITWNRPDCLSIIGIAREVAALYGSQLKLPVFSVKENDVPVEQLVRVALEDSAGCPRYTARVLSEIKIGPSPVWMQRRLTLCGIRPINNAVDITNYVLLECGQPLHAFDYKQLTGDGDNATITVRRARTGESMATLDDIKRDITAEMLVIADASRPVALAGVMGGAGSEICDDTSCVLLESAYFFPPDIRKTSTALGLATESSYRFERGIDVSMVEWASARAAGMFVEYAGAVSAKGVVDVYPQPVVPVKIKCRFQRVRDLIGITISDDEMIAILESLQITIAERGDGFCVVEAPIFRRDLVIEADIIEEVARMHGIDAVPANISKTMVVAGVDDADSRAIEICRANMVGLGLSEIMNYSFMSRKLLDMFDKDVERRVVLPNPVSDDYSVLRNSLLPHMGETLARNLAHQTENAMLFEIGRVFFRGGCTPIDEETRVAVGLMGKVGRLGMGAGKRVSPEEMYLWMKGIIENLFSVQKVTNYRFETTQKNCFEKGSAVSIYVDDVVCGVMGLLNNDIRSAWRMLGPVSVMEIAINPMITASFATPALEQLPVFPSISRDMAILVEEHVAHETVMMVVNKYAPPELTDVQLFDIYTGEGVGQGRKSLAYSLRYCSSEKTLTDEDANRYHEKIKDALKTELNAEIR